MPKTVARSRSGDRTQHEAASHDGTCRLTEYASSAGLALRVDAQAAIIRGVKVLGLESSNGRRYEPAALKAALPLYEGRAVNVDHVDGQRRSYRDRIGRLTECRYEADGIFGTLQLNPHHPLTAQVLWDAEHAPQNLGLSHDAQGRLVWRDGQPIVESITAVRSVDLVAEPATTRSLFESADHAADHATVADPQTQEEPAMNLATLTLEALKAARPDLCEALLAETTKSRTELKEAYDRVAKERDELAAQVARLQAQAAMAQELSQAGLSASDLPEGLAPLLESLDQAVVCRESPLGYTLAHRPRQVEQAVVCRESPLGYTE